MLLSAKMEHFLGDRKWALLPHRYPFYYHQYTVCNRFHFTFQSRLLEQRFRTTSNLLLAWPCENMEERHQEQQLG
jgi:hypothetical protein